MAEKALTAVIQEAYVQGILDPLGRRADRGHGHMSGISKPSCASGTTLLVVGLDEQLARY